MRRIGRLLAMSSLLCLPLSAPVVAAESRGLPPARIDIGELVKETTWQRIDPQGVQLVLWFPAEYWEAFLARQPQSASESRELVDLLSGYLMFAAVKGVPTKEDAYESAEALRAQLRVTLPNGESLEPLGEDQLPPQIAGILGYLKPVLAGSMGPMGRGMHFIVFPGKDDASKPLVEGLSSGRLQVSLSGQTHAYRLPLGALLEPMHDPGTGESFPGNYTFNPYTGSPLRAGNPSNSDQ